jgi:hypothetical protein
MQYNLRLVHYMVPQLSLLGGFSKAFQVLLAPPPAAAAANHAAKKQAGILLASSGKCGMAFNTAAVGQLQTNTYIS